VNAPAATDSATIVVCGTESELRLSHVAPIAQDATKISPAYFNMDIGLLDPGYR
jgi:hypothetical protein